MSSRPYTASPSFAAQGLTETCPFAIESTTLLTNLGTGPATSTLLVIEPKPTPLRTSLSPVERVWRASLGLLVLQLASMLIFTTLQYDRYNLTTDFAAYSQAWTAIAHGHINPYSSVFGQPFWRNDFELLLWPSSLLYWLYPSSVVLLWLQVLAVVGAEAVVLTWACQALTRARTPQARGALLLSLVALLLLVTPWSWFTIGFDVHSEPFVALFGILTAWDLFSGRRARPILWGALTLLAGAAPGSLCLLSVAVAALIGRRRSNVDTRIALGLAVAAVG